MNDDVAQKEQHSGKLQMLPYHLRLYASGKAMYTTSDAWTSLGDVPSVGDPQWTPYVEDLSKGLVHLAGKQYLTYK